MKYKLEILHSEGIYHIYNRANGFENLFQNDENYRFFLQQWVKFISPISFTLCYCLMPNHFHFLIILKSEEDVRKAGGKSQTYGKYETYQMFVSKCFSNFFSSYTQAFNKMYSRKGSLFMPNFKRKKVDNDSYLMNLFYYIHRNPVHHGFCSNFKDWKQSSYYPLISDNPGLLNQQLVFECFSDKQHFIDCHESEIQLNKEYYLE